MVVFIHVHQRSSLHNRCFMSQARWMQHFVQSSNKCEAWDEGRRKIKPLLLVHCSGSSAQLRPQVLTDGSDVKRTNQNTIHCSKIVTFLAARNTNNSKKKGNKCGGRITFNNVRLGVAKVRLARSKFSYVQTQQRRSKEGKRVAQTNSKVTSLWVMFGLSNKLVNQAFS